MGFVLIATGASSRSRVMTLPVRPLLWAALVGALGSLVAGGSLGYWLAAPPLLQATVVIAPEPAPRPHPFTLEQLGAISGRLFRLESEAAQLSERIGVEVKDPSVSPRRERGGRAPVPSDDRAGASASGGPLLPPRPEPSIDLGALDAHVGRVEQQIAQLAEAAAQRNVELMRLPTRLPVAGAELTSSFGNRIDPFAHTHAFHAGLDFAAERGTPITAAAGGIVSFAGFKPDFGWVVEIDHGNGLATRYAHASKLLVLAGSVVMPGDRIALVGSTGRSTGPHLHFELLRAGGPVDPKRYLAGL